MRPSLFALGLCLVCFCAGCGSGSDTAPPSPAPGGAAADEGIQAAGPRDPAENLELLVARSSPELVGVTVKCPSSGPPARYPFRCTLEAAKGSKRVGGSIEVVGVYPPTRTYAYELTYQPSGSKRP